jgi:hypothetical protein
MFELKQYDEYSTYQYAVCEIEKCIGHAEKIYLYGNAYLEVCIYHYDEMAMI